MTKLSGASEPRALLLAPEPPYPMRGGGPVRTASVLEYLTRRYLVDVITFRQPGAPDPAAAFPPGPTSVHTIGLPYHSASTPARVLRNLTRGLRRRPPLVDRFAGFSHAIARILAGKSYDVAVVEHFWCAQYHDVLRPRARRLLLDLHNIESAWHASLARSGGGVIGSAHRRFAVACECLERRHLPMFDALLVASEEDRRRIRSLVPDAPAWIYPNALPESPRPARRERDAILFTGNLEYRPNLSAIRWFRDRIWPLLRERWPDLTWEIAGMNPRSAAGLVDGDPRIHVTGPMDDPLARIAEAKIAVVPLLAGSGTRIKILEAWATATPVVSTRMGAEGLQAQHGRHLLLADTPKEFADAVSDLLSHSLRRESLGEAGRLLYETRFTWPVAWRALDEVLAAPPEPA